MHITNNTSLNNPLVKKRTLSKETVRKISTHGETEKIIDYVINSPYFIPYKGTGLGWFLYPLFECFEKRLKEIES